MSHHDEGNQRIVMVIEGEEHAIDPQEEADAIAYAWELHNRIVHPENYPTPEPCLNLGSGKDHFRWPGWINVDINVLEGWRVDLVADMRQLPFADNACARVYIGHVLEHLRYYTEAVDALIEAHRVLKPGGEITIVGPALDLAIEANAPQWLLDDIHEHVGNDDGLGHHWTPTTENTLALVRYAFPNAEFVHLSTTGRPDGWPNCNMISPGGKTWQVAIRGSKA